MKPSIFSYSNAPEFAAVARRNFLSAVRWYDGPHSAKDVNSWGLGWSLALGAGVISQQHLYSADLRQSLFSLSLCLGCRKLTRGLGGSCQLDWILFYRVWPREHLRACQGGDGKNCDFRFWSNMCIGGMLYAPTSTS